MGVHVEMENLGSIYGYYTKQKRVSIVKINENLSYEKQLFTCGHELGHHVLHPESKTPFLNKKTLYSTEKIETEAHLFSLELIFHNKTILNEHDLEQYGIPKQVALLRRYGK